MQQQLADDIPVLEPDAIFEASPSPHDPPNERRFAFRWRPVRVSDQGPSGVAAVVSTILLGLAVECSEEHSEAPPRVIWTRGMAVSS